jgi:hypothetical protein
LRKGEPLVAHQRFGKGLNFGFLCLRCDRKEGVHLKAFLRVEFLYASDLEHLDLHPCPICARPMYFSRYVERAVPCSYQCAYRRKVGMQKAKRRVQHETIACAKCGEMFEPTRSDAEFCSPRCRQKAYRKRKAVTVKDFSEVSEKSVSRNAKAVTADDYGQSCPKSVSRNANRPERKVPGTESKVPGPL